MSNERKDESAFPLSLYDKDGGLSRGITIRELLSGIILAGMNASTNALPDDHGRNIWAESAVRQADAIIKACKECV